PVAQIAPGFGKTAETAAQGDAEGADEESLDGHDQPAGDARLLAQAGPVLPLTPQSLVQTLPTGEAPVAQAAPPAGAVTQAQAPIPGFDPAPKASAAGAAATDAAAAALSEIAPPQGQAPANVAQPAVPPVAGQA